MILFLNEGPVVDIARIRRGQVRLSAQEASFPWVGQFPLPVRLWARHSGVCRRHGS